MRLMTSRMAVSGIPRKAVGILNSTFQTAIGVFMETLAVKTDITLQLFDIQGGLSKNITQTRRQSTATKSVLPKHGVKCSTRINKQHPIRHLSLPSE